ncbi:hypothetical protein [Devosia sp. DBB001]|nr:hypothetical protein [Devosia sp. DBB001]
MATLEIGGKRVQVDDSFLSLSPAQQQATVDEIASQIGAQPAYEPSSVPWLDRVNAFANSAVEAIPIVGPTLNSWGNNVDAAFASMLEGRPVSPEERAGINAAERSQFPIESGAGTIAGTVAPLMLAPQAALGGAGELPLIGAGNLLTRSGIGAVSGFGISGADTLARGGSANEAVQNALIGGGIGGAFPLAAKGAGLAWDGIKGVLSKAAQGGVDDALSQSIKSAARGMFDASDQAGVGVSSQAYGRFVQDLSADLRKMRINDILDPKASAALGEFMKVGGEIGENGAISLGDLHILRQIAQKAAQSKEGGDVALGSAIIDKLDDFMERLTPADVVGGADPSQAVAALQQGIGTWHVARKVATLEDAIYKAQNQASGFENGLRTQFRAILNNPRLRKGFTPDELKDIELVVQGSPGANALKLLGKFGFGGGNASNMLGGAVGALGATQLGGPVMGLAATLGASGARAGAEKMTASAVQRALMNVAGDFAQTATNPSPREAIVRAITQGVQSPVNTGPLSPVAAALLLQ